MKPETEALCNLLRESSDELRAALEGLSEDDAALRPAPDCWSVRECIEHLALVERGMLSRISSLEPGDPITDDPVRTARIAASMRSRSGRVPSPPSVAPSGRFASVAEGLADFDAARVETLRCIEEHEDDLPRRTYTHPLLGPMSGSEAVIMMAGHVVRHAHQIEEIGKQTANQNSTSKSNR